MIEKYCFKYDAFYNAETGEFTEKPCGSQNCEFCKDRPKNHKDCGCNKK